MNKTAKNIAYALLVVLIALIIIGRMGYTSKRSLKTYHKSYVKTNNLDSSSDHRLIVASLPIYKAEVGLIVTKDIPSVIQFISEYYEQTDFTNSDFDKAGLTISKEGYSPIIWIPSFKGTANDISTLNHELLHVTFNILNSVGVFYADVSEEAYTYLLENISVQLYNSLLNK